MSRSPLATPFLVAALAGFLAGGCVRRAPEAARAHAATAGAAEFATTPTRDVYVLLLILDGARTDFIYDAVDQGKLPNFKEHVFDRGVRVKDAISVFPSVTTSGHQAFITGLYPGHSGITGLDWFDRSSGRVTDYLSFDVLGIREDLLSKTRPVHPDELFTKPDNLIDDLEGIPRATVYEPFHMGIPDRSPKLPIGRAMVNFVFHNHHELTREAADRVKSIYERPIDEIPRYVMATFLGHDVCQHHHGIDSQELMRETQYEDEQLGEIVARMKKAGIWDRTYIVLTSDHGQHRTGNYVSVPKLLRDAGLRPRGFYSARVNTFASQIAITSANIYLNKGDWRDAVTLEDLRDFPAADGTRVDLIAGLTGNPAIEFALVPEAPDRVHIIASGDAANGPVATRASGDAASAGRHGVVTRRSFRGMDYYSYVVLGSGGDPLRYTEQPRVAAWVNDGRFHAADAWGQATVDSEYPDAPVMLLQLFDGDRAGDLVVTAAPGWHFRPREYLSSHGGMGRDDMRVPLVVSGPDIAPGVIPFAHTADVYPTLRRVFGMGVSTARIDGRPLDEILPWVPAGERVAARKQPTEATEDYFAALAALEAFIAPADALGAPARDPAELFRELKATDYGAFAAKLEQEITRDATLRAEVAVLQHTMDDTVRVLDRQLRENGHDEFNDGLFRERRLLKRNRERSFILSRTLDRLDARIARGSRLRQVLELVRIADDVEELQNLYVMAQRGPTPVVSPGN